MNPVLLFDGVCGMCSRLVQFVLKRDRPGIFRFAPLQGAFAARTLTRHGLSATDLDTVYVVLNASGANETLLRESRAIAYVLCELGGEWRFLGTMLRALPRFMADVGYRFVAKRRYRVFGKLDACMLPKPEERARFLE